MKRTLKIVNLQWRDAFTHEVDEGEEFYLQNASGYLVENSRKCVKLAQGYSELGFSEMLTVPRAYVASMVEVATVSTKLTESKPQLTRRQRKAKLDDIIKLTEEAGGYERELAQGSVGRDEHSATDSK